VGFSFVRVVRFVAFNVFSCRNVGCGFTGLSATVVFEAKSGPVPEMVAVGKSATSAGKTLTAAAEVLATDGEIFATAGEVFVAVGKVFTTFGEAFTTTEFSEEFAP